jgi:dTDP-4-amino-4,6-dideoxygalactose transaminase
MSIPTKGPVPSFGGQLEQYLAIRGEIDSAVERVLQSGWYILGREVEAFEREFAAYCGVKHAVGCASGTEAIALALMALEIGAGDEVLTVAHTAVPTASAITMTGARPVFVDIDEHMLMDPDAVEAAVSPHTKAILPVHLYGQMADMEKILDVAARRKIHVVEDACQAHGAELNRKRAGSWGRLGCFSFYPTKNLGCYGDGGAVTTDDKALYTRLVMLRNYGQEKRYYHTIKGINSRLDELQAAVLRAKLVHLEEWNRLRRRAAGWYAEELDGACACPGERRGAVHVYHLYVIRTKDRDGLRRCLEREGITTLMHYPVPVHLQEAYKDLGYGEGDLPATEAAVKEILSLPMHPALTREEVRFIGEKIRGYGANPGGAK